MNDQEHALLSFLAILDDLGVLKDVILIGSWAGYLYEHAGVLEGYRHEIATLDLDLLVKNQHLPANPVHLESELREMGYVVKRDYFTSNTKIYDPRGLEVEFLLGKRGAGLETTLRTSLGVTAQTLRHMDILSTDCITVSFYNLEITVPRPESYAVHKMVINHERGSKKEKDADAIARLTPYLDEIQYGLVLERLTKAEKRHYLQFVETHNITLPMDNANHSTAVELANVRAVVEHERRYGVREYGAMAQEAIDGMDPKPRSHDDGPVR